MTMNPHTEYINYVSCRIGGPHTEHRRVTPEETRYVQ